MEDVQTMIDSAGHILRRLTTANNTLEVNFFLLHGELDFHISVEVNPHTVIRWFILV